MSKLAAKPPLEQELAHKFDSSSWDTDGYPTADAQRTPLTDKVRPTHTVENHVHSAGKLALLPGSVQSSSPCH